MLDALQWHILNATADDRESLEQIRSQVGERYGPADVRAVAASLTLLVQAGLMERMGMERMGPGAADTEAILKEPLEHWFRMSPRGKAAWEAEKPTYSGQ